MKQVKEKKVKLYYDFPTQLSTEIFKNEIWQRVTCKDFRSFNGPRRILKFDKSSTPYYEDYDGPVYLYETNAKLKDFSKEGMVYPYDEPPKPKLRQWENNFLADERIKKQLYGTEEIPENEDQWP
jgi:hypothetical protein